MVDFNPDFEEDSIDSSFTKPEEPTSLVDVTPSKTTKDVTTISHLLEMTLSHVEDDKKCREEISSLTRMLDTLICDMSIKELIEYLKVKIKEREFHVDCIFKAYNFVQKTELAKELLQGSDRKERIVEAVDKSRVNKLLGWFNKTDE